MPSGTSDVIDRRTVQRQLLEHPDQPVLWRHLAQAKAFGRTPVPAPPATRRPPQRNPSPVSTVGEELLRSSRPLRPQFHPVDSREGQAVGAAHAKRLRAWVAEGRFAEVLRCLGPEAVEPLAAVLDPHQAYGLGHAAFLGERFDLACPLLETVVAGGDRAGDVQPWALLFSGLSLQEAGEQAHARERLQHLWKRGAGEPEQSWQEATFHAGVAMAWMDLKMGETDTADDWLANLRVLPIASGHGEELDLLGRVLSTLKWLEVNPREELVHAVDRAESCGFVAAIDAIRITPCGTVVEIVGWAVDPTQQLRELCLIRGRKVWRLDLGKACYSARADLTEVIRRCGGSEDLHAGLRLMLVNTAEERAAFRGGEAAELFVVLASGEQFCLRRGVQGTPLTTARLKEMLDVTIQHPCRLVSPRLLERLRTAWSDQVAAKLERSADHHRYGEPVAGAELSVVVPLYGRIDFMEYQLNWFKSWRRRRRGQAPGVQLIYVLDDPRLRDEFVALAKRCHMLYQVPFETVINPENTGFAGANNRGAEYAEAPLLLLLNSDVLPADDLSIELMLRAMQKHQEKIGALGARLIYENGAIQHKGMEFVKENDLEGELGQVWLNDHPLKGVNLEITASERLELQEVEAATAACLMLQTRLYQEIGGLSSQYIIGDFEDSDLCLKLRARGLPIYVDLAAAFFHLERQSVGIDDRQSSSKMKVVAANAITHHQLWCSSIEKLKGSGVES